MTHGVNTEIKKRQKDETCKALARKQVELDSLEEEEKSRRNRTVTPPFYVTERHGLVYRIKKVEKLSMHILEKK
jgi:hypothetical protein